VGKGLPEMLEREVLTQSDFSQMLHSGRRGREARNVAKDA